MFLVGVDHWMKVLTSRVRKNKNTTILFALYRVAEETRKWTHQTRSANASAWGCGSDGDSRRKCVRGIAIASFRVAEADPVG